MNYTSTNPGIEPQEAKLILNQELQRSTSKVVTDGENEVTPCMAPPSPRGVTPKKEGALEGYESPSHCPQYCLPMIKALQEQIHDLQNKITQLENLLPVQLPEVEK